MSTESQAPSAPESLAPADAAPGDLQARIRMWLDDYRPADAVERELVERAARLSWSLNQADREEDALLSRRIRAAALQARTARIERNADLARKLFHLTPRRTAKTPEPGWTDDPAVFVAGLEETSEGAQWLLDRWREQREFFKLAKHWCFSDQFRFVRLLGKHPIDAVDDAALNRIFMAWEGINPGMGSKFWERMQALAPQGESPLHAGRTWRAIVPKMETFEEAAGLIMKTIDDHIARYRTLVNELKRIEAAEAPDLVERATYRASPAGDRLRRAQSARTRELHKTLEMLTKLRAARANESSSENLRREGAGEDRRNFKRARRWRTPQTVLRPLVRPSGGLPASGSRHSGDPGDWRRSANPDQGPGGPRLRAGSVTHPAESMLASTQFIHSVDLSSQRERENSRRRARKPESQGDPRVGSSCSASDST